MNELVGAGVIQKYALFGAAAQMRYTEPIATLDADVLVAVPAPERLEEVAGLAGKHGLEKAWQGFAARFLGV